MNSIKSNNQKQEQQDINKYETFFPGFQLKRDRFAKNKTRSGKSWPLAKSPLELYYDQFVIECVNPSNNTFNMPIDENGYPIKMPDNGPGCRHVVNSIIRLRTASGDEKLYSQGQLIGYDAGSVRRSMACDKPEVWESVRFGYEKDYNKKTKRFETYCIGPRGGIDIKYLLEFNKENFDKLYAKTWDGKNEYFKPDRRNIGERVVLIAKDEQSGIAKKIFFATLENSIDIFLTRSFEDLITDAYLPRAMLEQRRA